jgi:integrase
MVIKARWRRAERCNWLVRPGELRKAEWYEIETERALWRIPAAWMKMRVEHWVPLSRQALQGLDLLRPLTGSGRFVMTNI